MKLLSVVLLLAAYLQLSHAWVLRVEGYKEKYENSPYVETFSSRKATNDCYNFSSHITDEGVLSFDFCTIQMYQCELAFFSNRFCQGEKLGESGGRGYSWSKYPVSKAGSKMESFRISGCVLDDLPIVGSFRFDTFRIADC